MPEDLQVLNQKAPSASSNPPTAASASVETVTVPVCRQSAGLPPHPAARVTFLVRKYSSGPHATATLWMQVEGGSEQFVSYLGDRIGHADPCSGTVRFTAHEIADAISRSLSIEAVTIPERKA